MVDITGLYFVIADGTRARFVRPGPDGRLHTIRAVGGGDLNEPEADPPGPRKGRFVRQLARRISEDFSVDLFSWLVVVAPPLVLRELTEAFDAPTRARLIGSLPMDLLALPDAELWTRLDEWVQSACPV